MIRKGFRCSWWRKGMSRAAAPPLHSYLPRSSLTLLSIPQSHVGAMGIDLQVLEAVIRWNSMDTEGFSTFLVSERHEPCSTSTAPTPAQELPDVPLHPPKQWGGDGHALGPHRAPVPNEATFGTCSLAYGRTGILGSPRTLKANSLAWRTSGFHLGSPNARSRWVSKGRHRSRRRASLRR